MDNYQIITTPEKGRALHATKAQQENDTIFVEEPLVVCQFSWNTAYGYLACEYCMKPLETAESNVQRLANDRNIKLSYPECCPIQEILHKQTSCPQCGVKYCSENCLNIAASKYHATICLGEFVNDLKHPINRLNEEWKKMHYPPETCSIMLIVKILAMIKQSTNKEEILARFADFCDQYVNEDLSILHKLLGDHFAAQIDVLYSLTCNIFGTDENLKWLNPEGFRRLLALIGTNGQGVGTSAFAEWVKNVEKLDLSEKERDEINDTIDTLYSVIDDVAGTFLDNEGSGLYNKQSKINHSCTPNAEIQFLNSNFVLTLKATKNIEVGQEICISYLSPCMLDRSRHSRQKMLRENYLFVCQCAKCEEQVGDADVTSDEEEEDDDDDDECMES